MKIEIEVADNGFIVRCNGTTTLFSKWIEVLEQLDNLMYGRPNKLVGTKEGK